MKIRNRQKTRYAINPYARILTVPVLLLCSVCTGLMLYFAIEANRQSSIWQLVRSVEFFGFVFVLFSELILLVIFAINSFEYFGVVEIYSDELVFYAFFHKPRVFRYEEIRCVEVDYGDISGMKQFWIIFSKQAILRQYQHRANRIPFSVNTMKIAYSDEVYKVLCNNINDKRILKQLHQAQTTLRLYGI